MTDTERLDWLQRMIPAAICERIFESGFRVPCVADVRVVIDAAMADAAPLMRSVEPDKWRDNGGLEMMRDYVREKNAE